MKKVLLLVLLLNIFSVLSVCAQSTSELRQKAMAESKRFYNELKAYNKSQDFELAVKIDVDMPVKNVLEEYEKVSRSYKNLFQDYYNCFDGEGERAVSSPGWEIHNLAVGNTEMMMSLYWMLLKLKIMEQAYFQNPTDQGLRNQVLKSRQEFKERYFNSGYAD